MKNLTYEIKYSMHIRATHMIKNGIPISADES